MLGDEKFIKYDYKEITVEPRLVPFFTNAYENFGWEKNTEKKASVSLGKVKLFFQRNHNITNKTELTRLQRNFNVCVKELRQLEKAKTSLAAKVSLLVGLLGIILLSCSVFAKIINYTITYLWIILGIPGVILIILPFFIYSKIKKNKTKKLSFLIEEKYKELYSICEKGKKLVNLGIMEDNILK